MKKAVDVIERTLEKDKKDFISVCKIAECFSIIMLAISIVAAIAFVIMAVVSAVGISDGGMFGSPKAVLIAVSNITMLIAFIVALNFASKVFNKLKTGETPFQYDIADKIRGAGIALVAGTAVSFLINALNVILMECGVIADVETAYELYVDVNYAVFGVVLMALAYIFNYGCKLQQEADETL